MTHTLPDYAMRDLHQSVAHALQEDIHTGDITAQLIPATQEATATVITRQDAVVCGRAWVESVFEQIDKNVTIQWHVQDGDSVTANQTLFTLKGNARSLLTGERSALNFYQTLSGTATTTAYYANLVKNTQVKLLDTRKTLPLLRNAQKYAVTCGGGHNHRIGLYDAFLIKENHIAACGGITNAIQQARSIAPNKPVEVEVETQEEYTEALNAQADIIMLDNFSLTDMEKAVEQRGEQKTKLEASGDITAQTLLNVAKTGVDYISIGALTKHIEAVDLSMRLNHESE